MHVDNSVTLGIGVLFVLIGLYWAGAGVWELARPSEKPRYFLRQRWSGLGMGLFLVMFGLWHGSRAIDSPFHPSHRTALLLYASWLAMFVVYGSWAISLVGRWRERRRSRPPSPQ